LGVGLRPGGLIACRLCFMLAGCYHHGIALRLCLGDLLAGAILIDDCLANVRMAFGEVGQMIHFLGGFVGARCSLRSREVIARILQGFARHLLCQRIGLQLVYGIARLHERGIFGVIRGARDQQECECA
jgi:hypothetical protein